MPDKATQERQQQQAKEQKAPPKDQAPPKKQGPGVKAAQALLQQGISEPAKYARVIREYPEDKDTILSSISKSALGASFANKVVDEAGGMDMSIKDKRLSYVDEDGSNYFVADAKRKGAEFKFGETTGKADKDGLVVENPNGNYLKAGGKTDDGKKRDGAEFQLGDTHGTINKKGLTATRPMEGDKEFEGNLNYKDKKVSGYGDVVNKETGSRYGVGANVGTKDPGGNHGVDVHGSKKIGDGKGDAKLGYSMEGGNPYAVGSVGYKDKEKDGRLNAKYGGTSDYDFSLGGSKKIDDTRYRANLGYGTKDDKNNLRGGVGMTTDQGLSTDLKGRYNDGDNYQFDLTGSQERKKDTLYGGLGYGEKDGVGTTTGNIGLRDGDSNTNLSANYTDADKYGLNLSHTQTHSANLKSQSKLGYNMTGGTGTLSGSMRGQYQSDDFMASGGLGAQYDDNGLGYNADMDATGTLKEGSLYYEAFGGMKGGGGMDEPTYHMGGGLVFTPKEKMALSLTGVIDQDGGFDTRLQFDVFKKKVTNARGISERKKKSAVSVFMGYRQGMGDVGGGDMMNDRYGAGKYSHDEGQAYVGIGFKF